MTFVVFTSLIFQPSRLALFLSGEVPLLRIAAMAAFVIGIGYCGAECMRRELIRDAKKERRDRNHM
jgi:hypothetical protein